MREHNVMSKFEIVTAIQANSICKQKKIEKVNNVMAMVTFSLTSNVSQKYWSLNV